MNKLPLNIYFILLGFTLMHSAYYYPQLPDWLASHFEGSGKADNWSSKQGFFIVSGVILIFNIGIFVVLPWAMQRFGIVKVNVPNKAYWLDPERIDEFYVYFRNKMCWFGIVNLLFGLGVMHLVFIANLGDQILDNRAFLSFLGGYFVFVILWLVSFFWKLGKDRPKKV